jgi:hypothetical protein
MPRLGVVPSSQVSVTRRRLTNAYPVGYTLINNQRVID